MIEALLSRMRALGKVVRASRLIPCKQDLRGALEEISSTARLARK